MERVSFKLSTTVYIALVGIAAVFAVLDGHSIREVTVLSLMVLFALTYSYFVHKKISLLRGRLTNAIGAMAKGDLTTEIISSDKDEFHSLYTDFSRAIDKLKKNIRNIEKAATILDDFTDKSEKKAIRSAEIVEDQTEKIDTIATAIEEMSNTVASIAEDVQEVNSLTDLVNKGAKESQEALDDMMSELNDLVDAVNQSNSTFDIVEKSASQIDQFLKVITDVAEQTNLLALNAAIEAARAGEYGRGFAVVADEVRQLASRTQVSANEINNMTTQLFQQIKSSSKLSDKSQRLAGKASNQASETSKEIEKVLDRFIGISDRMTSLASAIEQQRVVSEDVAENINKLTESGKRAADISEENKEAMLKISELAESLKEDISQFKLAI